MSNENKTQVKTVVRRRVRRNKNKNKQTTKRKAFENQTRPIARTQNFNQRGPSIRNAKDSIFVTHREFVTTINTNSANWKIWFNTPLNPGNSTMFPWLSKIASNYETYVVESYRLHYVPTCATTTTGNISVYIDYDASDAPPINPQQLLNSTNAVNFAPYSIKYHTSTRQQLNKAVKERYVDAFGIAGGEDIKLYDFGRLFISTSGTPVNADLGNLFAEYTIRLKTPIMATDIVGLEYVLFNQLATTNAAHPITTLLTNATWYGDPNVVSVYDNIGAFDSFGLKPGHYIIYYDSTQNSGTLTFGFNSIENFVLGNAAYERVYLVRVLPGHTIKRFDINGSQVGACNSLMVLSISTELWIAFRDIETQAAFINRLIDYPFFNNSFLAERINRYDSGQNKRYAITDNITSPDISIEEIVDEDRDPSSKISITEVIPEHSVVRVMKKTK